MATGLGQPAATLLSRALRAAGINDIAIVTEGRYFWSKKDMSDDFSQNRIDLGGWAVTAGFHVRF